MNSPPAGTPAFLTVQQIADRLGVSTKTIRRWLADGQLAFHRFGRQIRIAEPDFSIFIKINRHT